MIDSKQDEAVKLEACPDCGREVFTGNPCATGYLAECGRRVAKLASCMAGGCDEAKSARTTPANLNAPDKQEALAGEGVEARVVRRWCGTHEQEAAARARLCKGRCARWGKCDDLDGSCDECTMELTDVLPCPRAGCPHKAPVNASAPLPSNEALAGDDRNGVEGLVERAAGQIEDVLGNGPATEPKDHPTVGYSSGHHGNDPDAPDDTVPQEAFNEGHTRGWWEACQMLEPILASLSDSRTLPSPGVEAFHRGAEAMRSSAVALVQRHMEPALARRLVAKEPELDGARGGFLLAAEHIRDDLIFLSLEEDTAASTLPSNEALAGDDRNGVEGLREALESAWTDFLDANPDGLTSPEDLPNHALVTCEQMIGIVDAALSSLPVRSGEVDCEAVIRRAEAAEADWQAASAEAEKLRTLLVTLEDAESFYRAQHDQYGDGSAKAGRAWDLMRRAGDNARAALAPPPQAQEVDHG